MKKAYHLFVFSILVINLVFIGICFASIGILGIVGFPLVLAESIAIILFYLATAGFIILLISLIVLVVLLIQKVFKDRQMCKYYGR